MQVTQEDGGRLNAFAKEPQMQVLAADERSSKANNLLLIGGALLVLALMAVAVGLS
jgi:hypothetical protein